MPVPQDPKSAPELLTNITSAASPFSASSQISNCPQIDNSGFQIDNNTSGIDLSSPQIINDNATAENNVTSTNNDSPEERLKNLLRAQAEFDLEGAAADAIAADKRSIAQTQIKGAEETISKILECLNGINELVHKTGVNPDSLIDEQRETVNYSEKLTPDIEESNLRVLARDYEDAEYLTEGAISFLERKYNVRKSRIKKYMSRKRSRICTDRRKLNFDLMHPVCHKAVPILITIFTSYPRPRAVEIKVIQQHLMLARTFVESWFREQRLEQLKLTRPPLAHHVSQDRLLKSWYKDYPYPTPEQFRNISKTLKLPMLQIEKWWINALRVSRRNGQTEMINNRALMTEQD